MKTLAFLGKIAYPNQHKMAQHQTLQTTDQNQPHNQEPDLVDSGFSFKKTKPAKSSQNKLLSKENSISDIDLMVAEQPFKNRSVRSRFEDSLNKSQLRSKEQSHQKHALKPSLMPKIASPHHQLIENLNYNNYGQDCLPKKEEICEHSKGNSGRKEYGGEVLKQQIWQETKNGTNESIGQLKRIKKQVEQYQNMNPNCPKHSQSKTLMQDINTKFKFLNQKLTHLQTKNSSLFAQIQQTRTANIQNSQDMIKLKQERDGLLSTKDKWQNSKRKLQILYTQICSRVQREKEKENMGKEDCQRYFGSKSKENRPSVVREVERKPNLAARIKLRVERT